MTETAYGQPTSYNPLSKIDYRFSLQRAPATVFNIQRVIIPSLSLPSADFQTPFSNLPMHGDKIQFSEFSIDFQLDENMQNYKEIFNWMSSLGFPKDHTQHAKALQSGPGRADRLYSDGTLTILNSAKNSNVVINFYDMWPTSISQLDFDTTLGDTEYLNVNVGFMFSRFDFA